MIKRVPQIIDKTESCHGLSRFFVDYTQNIANPMECILEPNRIGLIYLWAAHINIHQINALISLVLQVPAYYR